MLNLNEDIKTRTFGVELEMCNFERSKIVLPHGFEWDEEEIIDNTDCSSGKKKGGEINSAPLLFNNESFCLLDNVLQQMLDAGGKVTWFTDIHVHIYAGDLNVEQLKNLVLFEYATYPYFKRYTRTQEWNELIFNSRPLINDLKKESIKKAETIEQLRDILTNNSVKGYIRYAINVASYFVHDTVEFRCYKATENIEELKNCVEATYKMFYYAISHNEQDFMNIKTYEDFVCELELPERIPEAKIPLLYQGNPYSPKESYMAKSISYSSKNASVLYDTIKKHGLEELCIVNGFFYDYELFFQDKVKVSICCQDKYCHLLYMLANSKIVLCYNGKLEFLEEYNDKTALRQLALALYIQKLQKYLMSTSARNTEVMKSIKIKAKESIERTEKNIGNLFRLLTTCEFWVGSIQDAVIRKNAVFFNFGREKVQERLAKLIDENSDWDIVAMAEGNKYYKDRTNEFYELVENIPNETHFYYFSDSPYLSNLKKLAILNSSSGERWSAGRYLYSNKECEKNKASMSYSFSNVETNEVIPPDDLEIKNPELLKIVKVDSSYLKKLQKKYIKKVEQVGRCTYSFVVMYDKYTLGGFGFTLPKHNGFDLFQLTDFTTNNAIPRISKLILYCIQSKDVQKQLSRRMHKLCENVISLAYTHKPVSMKYRGVYVKLKEHSTSSYLAYEGRLGVYENYNQIIQKYQKSLKNAN